MSTDLSASVFRPVVVRLSEHPWFRAFATGTRPGRAVALRLVAGETLDDAIRVARDAVDRAVVPTIATAVPSMTVEAQKAGPKSAPFVT